jgi:hypothetical protein
MGGVGSGSWHRFDKKSNTDECQSIDVRYLHRQRPATAGALILLTVVAGWEAE